MQTNGDNFSLSSEVGLARRIALCLRASSVAILAVASPLLIGVAPLLTTSQAVAQESVEFEGVNEADGENNNEGVNEADGENNNEGVNEVDGDNNNEGVNEVDGDNNDNNGGNEGGVGGGNGGGGSNN